MHFEHDIKDHEIVFKIKVKTAKDAELSAIMKENADKDVKIEELQAKLAAMMAAAAPPAVE